MKPDKKPKDAREVFKTNRDVVLSLFILIRETKKWWLLPIWLVLGLLGLFVSLSGNSSLLPAIYAVF